MNYTKPRGRIYNDITELIGSTPLVRVNRLAQKAGSKANILAKLEFFNPLASVKDRIGVNIIKKAEESGLLQEGGTIVEATSGNTGIALAFAAAAKGYRLILTMPDTMSLERRKMVSLLGAELVLTPGAEGMKGALAAAQKIVQETPGAVMARQFENEANPEIHRLTTAEEIIADTEGKVDIFVSGIGTGGTITGVGKLLKEKVPGVKIVAVEPTESPVLSGGQPGKHGIQGIGAGFIPEILDTSVYDEVVTVETPTALETARQVALNDGIPVGISSGAALAAAIELGKRPENEGKNIVVIIPSFAERYLSTPLFEAS
ncbi:MAG: cysteine synthase A [Alphaproteobacteria bacterium]